MILNLKIFFIAIFFCSSLYSFNFESQISKILKDSIAFNPIELEELSNTYSTNPNFLFLKALIDIDGDNALEIYNLSPHQNRIYRNCKNHNNH